MLLSICIPTLNRAAFIGETLDSILVQMREDIEVVIVDGGSRDGTAEVVALRTARCPRVRYHLTPHLVEGVPKPSNAGYDRDCDHALQLATGRYCWILPDDDLVVPGGIERLIQHLETGVALVVANAEVRANDLGRVLERRRMRVKQDATFAKGEADRIMTVAGAYLSYAGGVVVRRDWWLARDRVRFYGSGFVHMGVLFQEPSDLDAIVIAEPLIWLRYGNALWTARAFEIWMFQWPALIWSFPLGDRAKAAVTRREPWRNLITLAFFRARGCFGRTEHGRLMALPQVPSITRIGARLVLWIPASLLNVVALMAAFLRAGRHSMWWLDLWQSPHNLLARVFARGRRVPPASG